MWVLAIHAILTFSVSLPVAAAEPAQVAKVVSTKGTVLMRKGEQDQGEPIKCGDPIYETSVINTASDSFAKILLSDRTIVDIGPSTLFKVSEFKHPNHKDRKVGLEMEYGKVRTSVNEPVGAKGKFQLRTRSATMGVRGTEFVVSARLSDPKQGPGVAEPTTITVLSGNVSVGSTQVSTGQQFSQASPQANQAQRAPQSPSQLSREQAQSVATESRQVDQTFQSTVNLEPTASQSGQQGQSPQATQTLAAVTEQIGTQLAEVSNLDLPPIGVPGVFGSNFTQTALPQNPISGNVNLSVQFTQ